MVRCASVLAMVQLASLELARGVVGAPPPAAPSQARLANFDLEDDSQANKLPFEAVFQGLCENSDLCDQTCYNLHDGTFECNCHLGFVLDANGYSCSKVNETAEEGTILYEKEASFVAVLDGSPEYDAPPRPLEGEYSLPYASDLPSAYAAVRGDGHHTSDRHGPSSQFRADVYGPKPDGGQNSNPLNFPRPAGSGAASPGGRPRKQTLGGAAYEVPYETLVLSLEEPRALPLGEAPPALGSQPGDSESRSRFDRRPGSDLLLNAEDEGPEAFLASQKSLESFQDSLDSFQESFSDSSREDKSEQRSKDRQGKNSSDKRESAGSKENTIAKGFAFPSRAGLPASEQESEPRSQGSEMKNSAEERNKAISVNEIEYRNTGGSYGSAMLEDELTDSDLQNKIQIFAYDDNQPAGRGEGEDFTSPGPNLEQKVPSVQPQLQATESLVPQCPLACGVGRCSDGGGASRRCLCPLGFVGPSCRPAPRIDTARFHGQSWVGFPPLREAYRDVQITIEFKPEAHSDVDQTQRDPSLQMDGKRKSILNKWDYSSETSDEDRSRNSVQPSYRLDELARDADARANASLQSGDGVRRPRVGRAHGGLRGDPAPDPDAPNGVLLVSGENDDLTGDFMAAVIINGYVEFRWDCGSGAGAVRSAEPVRVGRWNRLTVYRHRWDVLLQLNDGRHVQGRSEGLFSRITFREPLYVGGSYNLTSLHGRLGVSQGLHGCVRRLQVNDHLYHFYRADQRNNLPSNYGAIDGWDISACSGDACQDLDCQNGGVCQPGSPDDQAAAGLVHALASSPPGRTTKSAQAFCSCPIGYTGPLCQTSVNLEVPHFNGTSHLAFKALGTSALSWLELEVVFRSSAMDGLVVYGGHRSDGSGDYIALALSDAHVVFSIDLGSGSITLRSAKPIRPGVWHSVRVSRTGRRVWMYVDGQPPVDGWTPGGFTLLSLSQPLYLGGLPPDSAAKFVLANVRNLKGCVQKLAIGGRPYEFSSSATTGHNVGSCDHPCSLHPCANGGLCQPRGASYTCRCPVGFTDDHCRSRVVTQASTPSFGGKSFLKFTHPEIMKRVTGDKLHMWFRFRSTSKDGLLIWIGEDSVPDINESYQDENLSSLSLEDSLSLEIKDGKLVLRYNLGSGFAVLHYNSSQTYDNGDWHIVRLARFERQAQMTVDDGPELITFSPGDLVQLNVESALYIGGRETYHTLADGRALRGLEGCVSDLTLATDYSVDLITMATAGQNIEYC